MEDNEAVSTIERMRRMKNRKGENIVKKDKNRKGERNTINVNDLAPSRSSIKIVLFPFPIRLRMDYLRASTSCSV